MVRIAATLTLLAALTLAVPAAGAASHSPSKKSAKRTAHAKAPQKKTRRAAAKNRSHVTRTARGKAGRKRAGGMPADFKRRYNLRGPGGDPDRDGLRNYYEYLAGTNPRREDTNGDGVPDDLEDRDRDGLYNITEQRISTRPDLARTNGRSDAAGDRDRDRLTNLSEQRTGNDPTKGDSDRDGTRDGAENAGRITAFDPEDGSVTVKVADSGVLLSGHLDDGSDLSCAAKEDGDEDQSGDLRGGDDLAGDPGDEEFSGDPDDEAFDDGGDDAVEDDASATAAVADDDGADDDGGDDDDGDDSAGEDAGDDVAGGPAYDTSDVCIDSLEPGMWVTESSFLSDPDSGFASVLSVKLFDA